AVVIAAAVASDAADLVIELLADGGRFRIRPFLRKSAGGSEEVNQGFDLVAALRLRQGGERVGHGRAGLDRLGIAEEFAEKTPPYPTPNAVENRCFLAWQRSLLTSFRLMTANAI